MAIYIDNHRYTANKNQPLNVDPSYDSNSIFRLEMSGAGVFML